MPRPWLLPALVILLACGSPGSARADEPPASIYTGTLGRHAVVVELTPDADAQMRGHYFYTRHHVDLELGGKASGPDHLELLEGPERNASRPSWMLDRQADGGWLGSWRRPDGTTLPIRLQPARPAPPPADAVPYLRQLSERHPYEYLRLAGLSLRPDRRERFMGHTLQWWVQPDSGITLFEILDGYPDAVRRRLNRVLMSRLWQEVDSSYACSSNPFGQGSYEQTVTPGLLTDRLVSVSVFTNYDCGGAHPDFGDSPINLDARTARTLALEDLVWIGQGKSLHHVEDNGGYVDGDAASPGAASFDAWSDYREKVFAPWLVEQWKRLYPTQLEPSQDDCDYADPGVWQFVSWHMSPEGIVLGPSFARAMRVCEANDDWSTLPWRVVRRHPGPLARDLPGSG